MTTDKPPYDQLVAQLSAANKLIDELQSGSRETRIREAKLLNALDIATEFILSLDLDGTILDINRVPMGLDRDQVVGTSAFDFEHGPALSKAMDQVRESRAPVEFENQAVGQNGLPAMYRCRLGPLVEDEELKGFLLCGLDITEQQRVEETLNKSREQFRSIVEATTEWIWEMDLTGRHTYTNPRVMDILGYTPQEFCGIDGLSLIHPEDRKEVDRLLPELIAKKQGWRSWVVRFRHKNGDYRFLESNAKPILNKHGETIGFRGVDRDITDRRRVEREHQQQATVLRSVLDSMEDAVFVVSGDGAILLWNPAAEEILHADPSGCELSDFNTRYSLFSDDATLVAFEDWPLSRALRGEHVSYHECLLVDKERAEDLWIQCHARPLADFSGQAKGAVVVFRDITEQKLANENLKASKTRLQDIIDSMFVFVGLYTPEGVLIEANRAPLEAANLQKSDVIGKPFWETYWWSYSPEVQAEVKEALRRAANGETVRYDVPVRVADGELIVIDVTFGPIYDDSGDVVQLIGSAVDISDRKHAEQAWRESEQRYRTFVEHSREGIALCEFDEPISTSLPEDEQIRLIHRSYCFVTCNDAFAKMYGFDKADELIGKRHEDIDGRLQNPTPINIASLRSAIRNNYRVSNMITEEFDRHGNPLVISNSWSAVVKDGRLAQVWVIQQDITERAKIETALLASESRNSAMLAAIPDIILQIRSDGVFTGCQTPNDEILAIPPEGFLGKNINNVMPAEFAKSVMERVSATLQSGEVQRFEYRLPVPLNDSQLRDFEARLSVVNDEEVLALIRETTERKKAEELLRIHDRALASTINGVLITDPTQPDNPIIYCNAAFQAMTGYSKEEVLGRNCRFLQGDECDQPGLAEVRRAIREQRGCRVTVRNFRKNGEPFWNELTISPVFDEQDRLTHFIGIQNDITEREMLIGELEAKNTELEHFAYTISHDLRNPLVTIRGFAGFLEQDSAAGNAERMAHDLHRITEAVDKMEALLNDLLELSRIGQVVSDLTETSLTDVVHETLDLLAGPINSRNVEIVVDSNLPTVRCDRLRMVEVFQNLIDNAIKFSGGRPRPRIEIRASQDRGETVCRVRDNGIGIEPRHHGKVFGLFNRLDPEAEGTGFGLTLVRKIIESHGGRVWVESEGIGQGCTVCFTIESIDSAVENDECNAKR